MTCATGNTNAEEMGTLMKALAEHEGIEQTPDQEKDLKKYIELLEQERLITPEEKSNLEEKMSEKNRSD